VIRRGDSFQMTLTFDRPYSNEKNDLKLTFSIGMCESKVVVDFIILPHPKEYTCRPRTFYVLHYIANIYSS